MIRDHSQNHYGQNASFDGYDSDLASAGILIESMRQQLAEAQEREQTNDTLLEQQGDKLSALHDLVDELRQQLAEAQAESENLRNVLYQARQDHGYELARLKRIASEQLDSRDAEVARLKGMVDEIHAARKVVNQHDKLLAQIHTLRQQLAKAGMS